MRERLKLSEQLQRLIAAKGLTIDAAASRARLSIDQVTRILDGGGRWRVAEQLANGLGKTLAIRDAVVRAHKMNLVELAYKAGLSITTVQEVLRHIASPRNSDGGLYVSSVEAILWTLNDRARIEIIKP